MHTRRRFFTLSSITALGAAFAPTLASAKPGSDWAAGDLPAAPAATELQSEFERYLTGAAAAQCDAARQMCAAGESAHD